MFNIMVIEDNAGIRGELVRLLESHHYRICAPERFDTLVDQVRMANPDLILLDIMLPGTDGYAICEEIRRFSDIPIMFVTSRDSDRDELMSMTIGGDDFMTKPYNTAILLARINALLRRTYPANEKLEEKLEARGYRLNVALARLEYGTVCIELTRNEFRILYSLFRQKDKIVPRLDLIEHLWDNSIFIDDNALTVHITRIRKKIEERSLPALIQTRRGQGYQL